MMPFFALVMIESRLVRMSDDLKTEIGEEALAAIAPSLWTFIFTSDIEPTNNAAEQALRPAVIWRRTSFGSQSASGSQFVARLNSLPKTD